MSELAAVLVGDGPRPLPERLDELEGVRADLEVCVVLPRLVGFERRRCEALAAREDLTFVDAPEGPLAAARNVGVGATSASAVFFVDSGYSLDSRYVGRVLEALSSSDVAAVTSWLNLDGPGSTSQVSPARCDLSALLADPGLVHPCTVFSRVLWQRLGGFDDHLPELELLDFWIRALAEGTSVVLVEEALVTCSLGRSDYRRKLVRARYLPAFNAVFSKHRELFEGETARILEARERVMGELGGRRDRLLSRRQDAAGEVERLNREISELSSFLRSHGEERVSWGDLRRTAPISPEWGTDRGKPVDRRYIEEFLAQHADDIHGSVLEVQEAEYTEAFGGARVEHSDVLDLNPLNPGATVVADLRAADAIADASYDCLVLTQTLHVIDDVNAALRECLRILKPGGVLLATFPCLSRVCLEYGPDGDLWRFTEAGVRHLLGAHFPPTEVETRAYGNVLTATAFLYGLACEELAPEEFEVYDPFHPLLVGARAVKSAPSAAVGGQVAAGRGRVGAHEGLVLAYHRVAPPAVDPHGMCLQPATFRAQMEHLARHYEPLALGDFAAAVNQGGLPEGAVAVTFDDGYRDALTEASPVLVELGVPATFFVTVEGLGGTGFWWDSLVRVFFSTAELPVSLTIRRHGGAQHYRTKSLEERAAAHSALYDLLLASPPAQRDDVLRQLAAWSGLDLRDPGPARPLDGDELKELASRPRHDVGAHTVHHLALSHQPFETRRAEIMESKVFLEDLLGRRIDAFAYPYGDVCREARDLAVAASFQLAVTCEAALVRSGCDPYRLPRWTVPTGGGRAFAEDTRRWFGGVEDAGTEPVVSGRTEP